MTRGIWLSGEPPGNFSHCIGLFSYYVWLFSHYESPMHPCHWYVMQSLKCDIGMRRHRTLRPMTRACMRLARRYSTQLVILPILLNLSYSLNDSTSRPQGPIPCEKSPIYKVKRALHNEKRAIHNRKRAQGLEALRLSLSHSASMTSTCTRHPFTCMTPIHMYDTHSHV